MGVRVCSAHHGGKTLLSCLLLSLGQFLMGALFFYVAEATTPLPECAFACSSVIYSYIYNSYIKLLFPLSLMEPGLTKKEKWVFYTYGHREGVLDWRLTGKLSHDFHAHECSQKSAYKSLEGLVRISNTSFGASVFICAIHGLCLVSDLGKRDQLSNGSEHRPLFVLADQGNYCRIYL